MTSLSNIVQQSDSQVFMNMANVYGIEYTLNFFTNMYWHYNQYNLFATSSMAVRTETLACVAVEEIPPLDYFNFDMLDSIDCLPDTVEVAKMDDRIQNDNICKCRFCDATFASTDGVRKHCRNQHSTLMQDVTRGKPDEYCVRAVKKK